MVSGGMICRGNDARPVCQNGERLPPAPGVGVPGREPPYGGGVSVADA